MHRYDEFTTGIISYNTSVVKGKPVHISPWRWTHPTTPPMTKAYFGLTQGNCSTRKAGRRTVHASSRMQQEQERREEEKAAEAEAEAEEVCDVFVSYDRDANGGEGPDCPMCKVHRLHGNEDKVFVMRVSVAAPPAPAPV